MGTTSHKTPLLSLIEKARAEGRAFWDGLSEAERSAQGTPDHWSAKDVMGHIVTWNDYLAADLEAAARGEAPPERIDDFNEANRERTWEDLGAYEATVSARLVAAVEEHMCDSAQKEYRAPAQVLGTTLKPPSHPGVQIVP